MTQQFYTLENIKEFLNKHGYKWTGKLYNASFQNVKDASPEDFNEAKLLVMEGRNGIYDKKIFISNYQFITFEDHPMIDEDLSHEWCLFLLSKYGKDYAKHVFNWSVENMTEIKKDAKEKIESYSKDINAKSQQRIDYFDNFAQSSLKYISKEDLFDSTNDYDVL